MTELRFVTHDTIRTTSAAYLLAVGQAAIQEFAALRGVDMTTMLALHKEAVEAWTLRWGCDMGAVVSEADAASLHIKTLNHPPVVKGEAHRHHA